MEYAVFKSVGCSWTPLTTSSVVVSFSVYLYVFCVVTHWRFFIGVSLDVGDTKDCVRSAPTLAGRKRDIEAQREEDSRRHRRATAWRALLHPILLPPAGAVTRDSLGN